jgi:hypothetical protein
MSKKIALGTIATLICVVLFAFNNCSDVSFKESDNSSSSVNTTGPSGSGLTDQTTQELINRLPPEEVTNPRPITDLITNPELYERYKCPDSDGVVICHFPDNVEAQVTQCVGRPAVDTHYDHVRNYNLGAGDKTIQDYLGPCRVAL